MKTLLRHILALILLVVLIYLSSLGREELESLHFFNRTVADASYLLLCLTLVIGPLVKFVPRLRFLLPWRRELGIAFMVAAGVHVLIYTSHFRWDVLRFFSDTNQQGRVRLLENPFAISNWIGLLALLYAVILGLTSNDVSQRMLGKGWKFLQQQSYTLFVLVLFHIAIFLYLVLNPRREPGYFPPIFIVAGVITILLQTAGYLITVRRNYRLRRRHRIRVD